MNHNIWWGHRSWEKHPHPNSRQHTFSHSLGTALLKTDIFQVQSTWPSLIRTAETHTGAGWWECGSCWPSSIWPAVDEFILNNTFQGTAGLVLPDHFPVKCCVNINPVTTGQKRVPAFLSEADDVMSVSGPHWRPGQWPSGCQGSRFQMKISTRAERQNLALSMVNVMFSPYV
jgi:hypothetical protein